MNTSATIEALAVAHWPEVERIYAAGIASLAIHRAVGFRETGTRERVGRMTYGPLAGHWRDVVFIEHRSPTIGSDPETGTLQDARSPDAG